MLGAQQLQTALETSVAEAADDASSAALTVEGARDAKTIVEGGIDLREATVLASPDRVGGCAGLEPRTLARQSSRLGLRDS